MFNIFSKKIKTTTHSFPSNYHENILSDINTFIRLLDKYQQVYTSTIVSLEENILTFLSPIHNRHFVTFEVGTKLDIYFITSKKVFFSYITIDTIIEEGEFLQYKATLLEPITQKEQRKHFRLEYLIDLNCELKYTPTLLPNLKIDTEFEAYAKNISAGGILLCCKTQLPKDAIINIHFEFYDTKFTLQGRILTTGFTQKDSIFEHPTQFIQISESTINTLSQLIMRKQIDMVNT